MSTTRPEPRWPPRSPYEALSSSPTGRQKIRQYHDRTSPTPSPLKRAPATSNLHQFWQKPSNQPFVDEDGEEDEETLQLQLAALEAKIKLKKLRQKKNKAGPTGKENARPPSQGNGAMDTLAVDMLKSSTDVQIPVSPQRNRIVTREAQSPGRVLLGIDKGLKGKNISLRRPAEGVSKDDSFTLPCSSVSRSIGSSIRSTVQHADQSAKPKTFSEKIAETREQDKAQRDRADLFRKQRSRGFGVDQQEIDAFQKEAEARIKTIGYPQRSDSRAGALEFSRDEIMKATSQPIGGLVQRGDTNAGIRRSGTRGRAKEDIGTIPNAPLESTNHSKPTSGASRKHSRSPSSVPTSLDQALRSSSPETGSLFDPFSALHLSKRILPHELLTRTLARKHIFLLPDLLSAVKSPDFLLPDIQEPDHVVLAIVASKSIPLTHKGAHKSSSSEKSSVDEAADSEQNTNGKYMVLTLTDLKWTIDLFLFTTAYTKFRKLTPGTLVALLNPDLMPPPPGRADTGRFSLKLSSSDETVLEIGTSRDLGWCKSVRKDGKQCSSWIDKRHTEFCEFHVDVVVERTRRGRMEVQGMSAPFAPGGRKGGRTGYFGERRRKQNQAKDDVYAREGAQYDRGSDSRYFIGPSVPGGRSAAQLLDAEGTLDKGREKERVRKRLAEREKENEIARKLGEGGNGAGSEYLRLRIGGDASARNLAPPETPDPVDATSLGLLGNRATNVHLSPVKKRKGNALSVEGSRKKTRFVTDRGIKEAGRESIGGEVALLGTDDPNDDDELEVV